VVQQDGTEHHGQDHHPHGLNYVTPVVEFFATALRAAPAGR